VERGAAGEPLRDRRPYLGVQVTPLDAAARRDFGLIVRSGALIRSVDAESPASRAGLPVGGVIVAVGDRRVDAPDDLIEFMKTARPGQVIDITYYHERRAQRAGVTLGTSEAASPREAVPESDLPRLVPPRAEERPLLPRGGDRPLLPRGTLPPAVGEVERLIDRLLPRADAPPAPAPRGPDGFPADDELRTELRTLREQVRQLEARVAELEKLLGEAAPPPPRE
jgi:hypothetical protein